MRSNDIRAAGEHGTRRRDSGRRGRIVRLTLAAALLATAASISAPAAAQSPLVFQSDFGTEDGAVAAMKGVAASVDPAVPVFDLTHEIPPYDVWRAAYRLHQTAGYWPRGTVFVSVVDPGVGTDRRSVVLETRTGHYFVTPDNGTLTFVADHLGIAGLREIDETRNRREGSYRSHTFHGRDVYAYTGARLAAGIIDFRAVGPELPGRVVRIPHQAAEMDGSSLRGTIPVLDVRFGNVWTNIPAERLRDLGVELGQELRVTLRRGDELTYRGVLPFVRTFGEVGLGEPLVYVNSLGNVAIALNQDSFARTHGVEAGPDWRVELRKP